ncbi:MAG: thioredoxin family protein [Planctomycetes bacterium]|nr:thioredoxin family protein [Planctomycetota bacterium]
MSLASGCRSHGAGRLRLGLVTCLVAGVFAAGGLTVRGEPGQAKFNKVLKPGDLAPEFRDLPGVDGKSHGLDEYREKRVLVVVFTCNHCPVAKEYAGRLAEFVEKYRDQVQVVAISVSPSAADKLDKMQALHAEKPFPYPYLYDESQKSGSAYGAAATPHVFVLDAQRRIAYMGAFDDNYNDVQQVSKRYVVDAVEALLAGKEPPVKESLPVGCPIRYKTPAK